MATKRKKSSEIKRLKIVIMVLATVSLITFVLVATQWLQITPEDIIPFSLAPKAQVVYTNASIVYLPKVYATTLDSRYGSDSSEFIYCLYGNVYKEGYLIKEMSETKVLSAEEDYITYESCPRRSDYLGTIHSHPQPNTPHLYATCGLSKQDVYTFGASQSALTAIICNPGTYAFYGPMNLYESYEIKIFEVTDEQ